MYDVRLIDPYVAAIPDNGNREQLRTEALRYFRTLRIHFGKDFLPGACVAIALQRMRSDTRDAVVTLARLSGLNPIDFAREVSQHRALLKEPFELDWEVLAQAGGIPVRYAAGAAELFSKFTLDHPGEAMPETRGAALLAATKWKGPRREAAVEALALAGLFDSRVLAGQVAGFRPAVEDEEDPGVLEDRREALRRASEEIGPVVIPRRLVQTTLAFSHTGLSAVAPAGATSSPVAKSGRSAKRVKTSLGNCRPGVG